MITLPQLALTDTDLTGGAQTGKSADGAQDFLALLAGALADTGAQGKETTPLTFADLQAAGGKLTKAALQKETGDTPAAKLADLLARQGVTLPTDETTASLPAQNIATTGLLPTVKSDTLKTLVSSATKDDEKTDLSEEELAGLSALMAMLPHQQTATTVAAKPVADTAITQATLTQPATTRQSLLPGETSHTDKPAAHTADDFAQTSAQLTAPAAATTPAAKQDIESASSPSTPAASIAPVVASPTTPQPVVQTTTPVVSAPLGSGEWQQAVSQHITLFTKQGQQSAELHLHPEELGQVQISLKLDDNQAQLQMISPHSHVRAALEAALPVLRTQLAENGIQLGQSSIGSESFAGQQQSSQQQHNVPRSGNQSGFTEESDELLATPASLQSAARGNGAVDIFA